MSAAIRIKLFSGAFPVYPYMYTLRQFMRMNGVTVEQVEQFVTAVSGQQLSVRDIEQLAHGFFKGPDSLRQEILKGNIALPLKALTYFQDGDLPSLPASVRKALTQAVSHVREIMNVPSTGLRIGVRA